MAIDENISGETHTHLEKIPKHQRNRLIRLVYWKTLEKKLREEAKEKSTSAHGRS